ncbi:hypothetical protein AALO_G00115670 [Alosa alosa]|uniref:Uncharacterized protein n=1 Tax=Alosa alosa TaxID=278164 RepID=A0AAV6GQU0_9TELE|nr:hypothetical protein AALO_G00115670 [Alosa alosa]
MFSSPLFQSCLQSHLFLQSAAGVRLECYLRPVFWRCPAGREVGFLLDWLSLFLQTDPYEVRYTPPCTVALKTGPYLLVHSSTVPA